MSAYGIGAALRAADFIRTRTGNEPPVAGIILGSGLGGLADRIVDPVSISFADVPGFPAATVVGHAGKLIGGTLGGRRVVALAGRFHLYEGHDAVLAGFPVRVLHALGARVLFVSNAAGGIRRTFRGGDLMLIRDHLNLMFRNPLIGPVEPGDERGLGRLWRRVDTRRDPIELGGSTTADRLGQYVCGSGPLLAVTRC